MQPDKKTYTATPEVVLPDDSPDIYITEMDTTRFNKAGQPVMRAQGESLAVYNETGKSNIVRPIVTLLSNNIDTWRVTSEKAIISSNEDIEFITDVVAINLQSTPEAVIRTNYLIITRQGELIETELAVEITQGTQILNAVGMEIELNAVEPVIHLKSEVKFHYDPS